MTTTQYESRKERLLNNSSDDLEDGMKDEETESDVETVTSNTVIVPSPVYPAIESYLYNTSMQKYR